MTDQPGQETRPGGDQDRGSGTATGSGPPPSASDGSDTGSAGDQTGAGAAGPTGPGIGTPEATNPGPSPVDAGPAPGSVDAKATGGSDAGYAAGGASGDRSGGADGSGGKQRAPESTGPMDRTGSGTPDDLAERNALWLAIAGFVLTLVPNLWIALAGVPLCSAAVVLGFRARRRARQRRTTASGADIGLAVGAAGLVFALVVAGKSAVFYDEISTYQRCMSVANTHIDRKACGQNPMFGWPVR